MFPFNLRLAADTETDLLVGHNASKCSSIYLVDEVRVNRSSKRLVDGEVQVPALSSIHVSLTGASWKHI